MKTIEITYSPPLTTSDGTLRHHETFYPVEDSVTWNVYEGGKTQLRFVEDTNCYTLLLSPNTQVRITVV